MDRSEDKEQLKFIYQLVKDLERDYNEIDSSFSINYYYEHNKKHDDAVRVLIDRIKKELNDMIKTQR